MTIKTLYNNKSTLITNIQTNGYCKFNDIDLFILLAYSVCMKSRKLDQFYTKSEVAKKCIDFLYKNIKINQDSVLFIEPSAGGGSFYNLLPENNRFGLDIDPKMKEIIKADFFKYDFTTTVSKKFVITIGNPPFGKNSSLALKFLNKSANFSNYIAFIIPKTFKKNSTVKKINKNIHLIAELDLDKSSFIFNNNDYDVPCIFQIWEKKSYQRKDIIESLTHHDFIFSTQDDADFAIRRVGGLAGKIILEFKSYAKSSHYFIKATKNKNDLIDIFKQIDWNDAKYNTAGNPSISKTEIIKFYQKYLNNK